MLLVTAGGALPARPPCPALAACQLRRGELGLSDAPRGSAGGGAPGFGGVARKKLPPHRARRAGRLRPRRRLGVATGRRLVRPRVTSARSRSTRDRAPSVQKVCWPCRRAPQMGLLGPAVRR